MKNKFLVIICILIISIFSMNTCFAWDTGIFGYDSKNISVNTSYYFNNDYITPVSNAIGNWHYLAAIYVSGSCISTTGLCENTVRSGNYGITWYGAYLPEYDDDPDNPDHTAESFDIYLNEQMLCNESDNFIRSIMAHELGHAFGLDHSILTAVMNSSRNRDSVYTVQSDDVSGLNDSCKRKKH